MTLNLRRMITGLTLCLLAGGAAAQTEYPARAVRIIVPSPPSGGTDIIARVLAQHLSKAFGQQFFVDNKPGAGNMIGIEAAARSPADGYTLLMVASTLFGTWQLQGRDPLQACRDLLTHPQV